MSLLDHRLLIVTGKGGVGRTTTAATLGLAAQAAGKSVIVVEMDGLEGLSRTLGLPDRRYSPRISPVGLPVMSLTPLDAIEDFGRRKLRVNALVGLVFRSRVMAAFLDAVPGLNDLVQLGKIEDMISQPSEGEPHWDLVILDAPATGHGLTLLAAARSMAEITRVGPFFELASVIARLLGDTETTGIVLTTLAEELPVSESLQLLDALALDGCAVRGVLVNQMRAPALPAKPEWSKVRAHFQEHPSPSVRLIAELADRADRGDKAQRAAIERMTAGLVERLGASVPLLQLRRMPGGRLTPATVQELARDVADQLGAAT